MILATINPQLMAMRKTSDLGMLEASAAMGLASASEVILSNPYFLYNFVAAATLR